LNSIRLVLGAEATLDDAIAAALGGHRPAIRLFADVGEIIGRALAGVVNVLNPSRIVVGGDLASAGELLLGPMRDSVRRHALAITGDVAKIVEGSFGRMAGALGGVALVLQDSSRLVQPALNVTAVAADGALA
jgi:predicted NBD/HSP70 family sugar kinase